ncbi:sugar transferase [Novosphingobium sp. ZN18A2]|uniref:sugar transferase n=1 Tax=Novosphingobium sp. ZN18A2 TaxID=3079861 RepID=UPI0030D2BE8B
MERLKDDLIARRFDAAPEIWDSDAWARDEGFRAAGTARSSDYEALLIRHIDESIGQPCEAPRRAGAPLPQSARYRRASRFLDIAVSMALIVLLAPVLVLLTLVVAIASEGSPIFRHQRVGRDGKAFDCYKFRSMPLDADKQLERLLREDAGLRREWEQHHKLTNDPRIGRFGQFLRKTSLDELPQLWNVLRGDMGLVGPRPIVRAELRHYGRHVPTLLSMKPGLTGLWQVTCRSEASYRRRVAIDRFYARHRSLGFDIRILFATIPAVLQRRGAC